MEGQLKPAKEPTLVNRIKAVLDEVQVERFRQVRLWGQQDHTPHVWFPILAEEVGEVAKELADARVAAFRADAYRTELIHTAAVAVAAIEALDRGYSA